VPVDIYIPEKNLCFELDGSVHFFGLTERMIGKAVMKYRMFDQVGIPYFRLAYFDFLLDLEEKLTLGARVDRPKIR